MYVSPNFKTKSALKKAVNNEEIVRVFSPGLGTAPDSGKTWVEGPHFPEPHRWYAEVVVAYGRVIRVK